MPRAFDITPTSPSATPNMQGKAELSFSVSNKLGKQVRARAVPQPEGNTRREWLSIEQDPERDLTHDGTTTFTVKVAIPAGTAEGTYAMHLLVSSVNNPDEDYAHGPAVTFTVAPTAKPSRPFPWWIVALVTGALVIAGSAMALFIALSGKGPLDPCEPTKQGDCGALVCSPRGGGHVCLIEQVGGACKEDAHCLTARCAAGKCAYPAPGADCGSSTSSCPANQKCTTLQGGAKSCLLKPAESCDSNLSCSALWCRAGTCARDDHRCDSADECLPPLMCAKGRCALKDGLPCDADQRCISGNCDGVCKSAVQPCVPPCPKNFYCQRGRCASLLFLSPFNLRGVDIVRPILPGP